MIFFSDYFFSEDYEDEIILDFIEPIGYKHRVSNYYVIQEIDGYINIYYTITNDGIHIAFHKNFYNEAGKKYPNNTISKTFDNYSEFFKFLESYHTQYFRKQKLIKLDL